MENEKAISHTVNPYTDKPHTIKFNICNQLDIPLLDVTISVNGGSESHLGNLAAKESWENIPIVYRRYLKSNDYVIKWNYPDGSLGFVTGHFSKLHK